MNEKNYSSDKKSVLKFTVDSSRYEDGVEASTILADEYIESSLLQWPTKGPKRMMLCLGTDLKNH